MQPSANEGDLSGWLTLARITKTSPTLQQQQASIESWQQQNPEHPAAKHLPAALEKTQDAVPAAADPHRPPATPAGAVGQRRPGLQDGFLAAHFQAQQAGQNPPSIKLYDSTQVRSLDDFYRQAQADGVELVVGPLEKPLVKQLASREQLPITTLALNYSDNSQEGPAQLFQFGLAAEDESARGGQPGLGRRHAPGRGAGAARRMGRPRVGRLQPELAVRGRQPDRRRACRPAGTTGATDRRPAATAPERRPRPAPAGRPRQPDRHPAVAPPGHRLRVPCRHPQQARQIKPTLAFQYAGDLPVYATSHLYTGTNNPTQDQDLNGIRFCETPWLLNPSDPTRQQVAAQWPQANGSMGRLYAMGVDAYRLAPRLPELKAVPSLQIDGLTGTLSLNPTQRIERQLQWAEFRNGQVQPLGTSSF